MTVALDLGCSEFRSLRLEGNRLVARRIPAIYCVLSDDSSHRRLLDQARIDYSVAKGSLIVMGQSADELASLVRCPVVPVMKDGQLPWSDPVGKQVCSTLIECLLPPNPSRDTVCGLSVPASVYRRFKEEDNFVRKVLELRGYQASVVHPATALVLGELESNAFTGIGLTIGAEAISISVTHQGQPLFESTYAQGFRKIEQRFALSRHKYLWDQDGNRYLDTRSIQKWIREGDLKLTNPKRGDELWLTRQLHKLVLDAWTSLTPELLRLEDKPFLKNRLPVVVSGGPSCLDGFPDLVMDIVRDSCLPLRPQSVDVSIFTPYAVARGLMVHATLQTTPATALPARYAPAA